MLPLLASALLASQQTTQAPGAAKPPVLEWKVTGASMFKNGFSVVFREAAIPKGREFLSELPPVPTLGTLWYSASSGVRVNSVTATDVVTEVETVTHAPEMLSLLAMNTGQTVELDLQLPGEPKPERKKVKVVRMLGNNVLLDEDGTEFTVPVGVVFSMRALPGQKLRTSTTTKNPSQRRMLRFSADAPAGGKLYSMAVQSGLNWSPSYMLNLEPGDKLKLTAKAVITSDIERLVGIEVRLVTGFPSLAFLGQPDPLVMGAMVSRMGASGGFGGGGGFGAPGSPMMQNAAPSAMADGMMEAFGNPASAGFSAEDLFFYQLKGVNLKPGERGYHLLFEGSAEYRNVFKVALGSPLESGGPGQPSGPPDVWNTLEFKNPVGQPLTTAPGMAMKNGEVIGQDMINYTAPGGTASLRIGKALDVNVESTSEEVDRERGALKDRYDRPAWDKVTLKGVIEVRSRRASPVNLDLVMPLGGEFTATGEATAVKIPAGLRQVNPSSVLIWKPKIEPNGKARMEYTATVYVPIS